MAEKKAPAAKTAAAAAAKPATTSVKKPTAASAPAPAKPAPAPAPAAPAKPAAKVSPEQRWKLVAEAAYFLAEKRGFATGHAVADWLAAERQVDAKLRS
jgi:hypothetical protein